jgi:hypothetical protein
MNPRESRRIWALALALAAAAWAAPGARADAITYGTVGWVETPTGATPDLVFYTGTTGTVSGQGSLNLGQFEVSPAVLTGSNISYAGDPFHVIVYSGPNQSTEISGTLGGSVGPGPNNPPLTATISSVTPFGSSPLPFTLNVPTGIAMNLNAAPGTSSPSATIFSAAASPIPEPTSVAVFAVALGSLALWRRRGGR